mmetsp:Transcript_69510/g.122933  ORF Transcript_69510/g.122933 Transcript_69510/m.122933 type:complete len:102 (-) Transcript_69510:234-539(-)
MLKQVVERTVLPQDALVTGYPGMIANIVGRVMQLRASQAQEEASFSQMRPVLAGAECQLQSPLHKELGEVIAEGDISTNPDASASGLLKMVHSSSSVDDFV